MVVLWKYRVDASAKVYLRPVARDSVRFCRCQAGIGDTCLAPVADRSTETLLAIIKACILPAPQTAVTAGGYNIRLQLWTHKPFRQSLCEFRGKWMLTNTIKPTWRDVKVNLRPY